MSCITDNDNFTAVCTNPAVIETAFNQYLENEGPIDDEPQDGIAIIAMPSCAMKKIRASFQSESGIKL